MTSVKPKINMLTSDLQETYERLNKGKKSIKRKKPSKRKKHSKKRILSSSVKRHTTAHGGRTKSSPSGESGSTGGPGGQ